jgi:hypothetical protein
VDGLASLTIGLGDRVRRPQTGLIRNYVLFAAGGAAIVVLVVLVGGDVWSWLVAWIQS